MTSSSVSSLSCPLALAGRLSTRSAKCMAWKVTSSSERSLITAYLYDMSGHGEEPLRAVDLDLVFAAVGHVAADDNVKPAACGRKLCVTVEVADYLQSPQGYLAISIYTVVQVDARIRVSARKHKTYPRILSVLVGFQGSLKSAPREQVCAGSLAPSPGRMRHLV